jgi:hypothetical protein
MTLQQFHKASQVEDKDPMTFYTHLSRLAAIIKKDFNISDFFLWLNLGLYVTLTKNN